MRKILFILLFVPVCVFSQYTPIGEAYPWFSPAQDTAIPMLNGVQAGFNFAGSSTPEPTTSRIDQINTLLGRGFNAYGVTPMGDNDASNSWTSGEFYNIGQAGFDNLRLVLYSWDGDNSTHLNNIATLVDSCNTNGMIAIIDYHQPPWLRDSSLTTYNNNVNTWLDDWYKTADYLVNTKGYTSEEIVFELVNEPYNNRTLGGVNYINFNGDTWSSLMQTCTDTIRAAAGDSMAIIAMPYHGLFDYKRNLDATTFPDDSMFIVSMHYYWPNWATTSGLSGYSNIGDWEKIQPFYARLDSNWHYFESKGYPLTVGEWGVYQDVADTTKAKVLNDISKYFEDNGYSWSMWDYNWDFGVTTTYGGNTFDATFLNAMNHSPSRSFLSYDSTLIYQSDFSATVDGWTLNLSGTAAGSISVESGRLKVIITNSGSGTQDFTVESPTISMLNGNIYKLNYTMAWEDAGDNNRASIAEDMDGYWSWVHHDDIDSGGFEHFEVYYHGYVDRSGNHMNYLLGGGETGTFYIDNFRFERIDINY